jgi:hypothetical protein
VPKLGFIVSLALLIAPPLAAEDSKLGDWTAPEVMEFGDWSVACDNARECTAVSVSRPYVKRIEGTDPGDYAMPKLWVKRRAGPKALPRVFVDTSVWGESIPAGPLTLHVYYDCDGDCTGRAYQLQQIEPGRYELAPAQLAAFFNESMKTRRAATRFPDGSMHGVLTTEGLVAAMRYIDEAQERRGTRTAIYAKGKKPASAVPPEPVRQTVNVVRGVEEPITESYDYSALNRKRAEHCQIFGRTIPDLPIQRIKLANGQKLWSVDCNSTPHVEYRLWLVETGEDRFEIFKLPRPEQGRDAELPILPNSDFDMSSGQITAFAGMACGWKRRWAWTGSAFEMIDSIEMPACIDILPHQWLQTYRAIPE